MSGTPGPSHFSAGWNKLRIGEKVPPPHQALPDPESGGHALPLGTTGALHTALRWTEMDFQRALEAVPKRHPACFPGTVIPLFSYCALHPRTLFPASGTPIGSYLLEVHERPREEDLNLGPRPAQLAV